MSYYPRDNNRSQPSGERKRCNRGAECKHILNGCTFFHPSYEIDFARNREQERTVESGERQAARESDRRRTGRVPQQKNCRNGPDCKFRATGCRFSHPEEDVAQEYKHAHNREQSIEEEGEREKAPRQREVSRPSQPNRRGGQQSEEVAAPATPPRKEKRRPRVPGAPKKKKNNEFEERMFALMQESARMTMETSESIKEIKRDVGQINKNIYSLGVGLQRLAIRQEMTDCRVAKLLAAPSNQDGLMFALDERASVEVIQSDEDTPEHEED